MVTIQKSTDTLRIEQFQKLRELLDEIDYYLKITGLVFCYIIDENGRKIGEVSIDYNDPHKLEFTGNPELLLKPAMYLEQFGYKVTIEY